MQVMEIDGYTPNYNGSCRNCGESPTVVAVKNNVPVLKTGLCGVCCWGDKDCIDPDNWSASKQG